MFDADEIEGLIHELNRSVADERGAQQLLYREACLRFDAVFANIRIFKALI